MIIRLGLLLTTIILAGCASATPTPDPDGPILTGFDPLPKSLATVYLSPTPNAPQAQATLDNHRPTDTPLPPTFTATPTPYVGIFMGAPTSGPGAIIPTGTRGPVVTIAPQPGTRVAPNTGGSNVSTTRNCSVPAAPPFANAARNPAVQQKLGCPTGSPVTVKLVTQPFQTGYMFWRETREIYVVSTAAVLKGAATDTFWRLPDNWNEGIPASDPALAPPAGMLQPVRGFGYIWRSNSTVRSSLGWALAGEQPYDAIWQDFERGWMLLGNNGAVFALSPLDGPPATTGIHFGLLPQ